MTMSWKELKQKGNDHFTEQDYEGAVKFYTMALEQSSLEHTLYSNRSAAFSKLGCYQEALQDATKCIDLEPMFARGYLRKCVALNKLGRSKEAMEVAQEGYKLRGSDTISKNCVTEWLIAVQASLKEKIDSIQSEIDFEFPKEFTVISDDYLSLLVDVFDAYGNSTSEAPLEMISILLGKIWQEFDRVLQLFGHIPNPCGSEWAGTLCKALKIDPSSSKVPPEVVTLILKKSKQLLAWLHEEVDHILYPILRPVLCLAVMSMRVRFIYLNFLQIDQHAVEVGCRACLPLFEKSILSVPEYAEQHIELYNELLPAIGSSITFLSKDELQFAESLVKNLQSLLEQNPQCDPDVKENAILSIGTIQCRLGLDPGFGDIPFKNVLMSGCSIDEVLPFIETKMEPLKSLLNNVPADNQIPDSALRDSQVFLSCTGVLLKAGLTARAAEVFELGESVVISILKRRMLLDSFTLDTAPSTFFTMQANIFLYAKLFLGVNDKLLANVIIRWKCIFSELRALLMQSGLGVKYRATFKAIQSLQLKGEVSSSEFIQLSEEHQKEAREVMRTKGRHLLSALFQQCYEDIQNVLKPGQMILEYFPTDDEDSIHNPHSSDPGREDLLLILQHNAAPMFKSINIDQAVKSASKNITHSSCVSEELCNLLIPTEIQDMISDNQIHQIFFCPDPSFFFISLESLPLQNGQQLEEKCSIIRISAARELLRKSVFPLAMESSLTSEVTKEEQKDTFMKSTDNHTHEPLSLSLTAKQPSIKQCVIFADPNYDLEQAGDSSVLNNLITSLSALFLEPPHEDSFACPLPETRDEAHEIQLALTTSENSLELHCFLGDEVTVSSVLQVESPFLLHFSTHGYSGFTHVLHGTFFDDTKCGLLLAGANTYRRRDLSKVVPAAGAGVLTSLGAMGMNLCNTGLVYLSACSSAAGSFTSESINSLAEAFRTAGAQTVIATLFTVGDREAKMLTVHFYRELCKTGIRPSQALASAKSMMHNYGYHWVHWSSFICIGEDAPLFPKGA